MQKKSLYQRENPQSPSRTASVLLNTHPEPKCREQAGASADRGGLGPDGPAGGRGHGHSTELDISDRRPQHCEPHPAGTLSHHTHQTRRLAPPSLQSPSSTVLAQCNPQHLQTQSRLTHLTPVKRPLTFSLHIHMLAAMEPRKAAVFLGPQCSEDNKEVGLCFMLQVNKAD